MLYNWTHYARMLHSAGYLRITPFSNKASLVFFESNTEKPSPTVSPSHVRLPKWYHLVSLTPDDFFILLKLLSTAKVTSSKNSLALDPAAIGLYSLDESPIRGFLELLKTNWRMNAEHCDKIWVSWETIDVLANQPADYEHQLECLQIIAACGFKEEMMFFPINTMIDLELPSEQINDDYCFPPEMGNEGVFSVA